MEKLDYVTHNSDYEVITEFMFECFCVNMSSDSVSLTCSKVLKADLQYLHERVCDLPLPSLLSPLTQCF